MVSCIFFFKSLSFLFTFHCNPEFGLAIFYISCHPAFFKFHTSHTPPPLFPLFPFPHKIQIVAPLTHILIPKRNLNLIDIVYKCLLTVSKTYLLFSVLYLATSTKVYQSYPQVIKNWSLRFLSLLCFFRYRSVINTPGKPSNLNQKDNRKKFTGTSWWELLEKKYK